MNFLLPQQELTKVVLGLTVRATTDGPAGEVIEGKITAINPRVDIETRNVRIQATVANSREHLRPGMFVKVRVVLPAQKEVLAIPATAVLYAPYRDSVFVVFPSIYMLVARDRSKDSHGEAADRPDQNN